MTVRFTTTAALELREARDWYEGRSVGLGDRFVVEVCGALEKIEALPNAWPRLGGDIRRYRLNDFPYGLAYEVWPEAIIIIAVGHLRRRPAYWRSRLRRPQE